MESAPSSAVDQPAFTIFYKGSVNTFQQVPPEKAKAIMLLLSSCSSASSVTSNDNIETPLELSHVSAAGLTQLPSCSSCTAISTPGLERSAVQINVPNTVISAAANNTMRTCKPPLISIRTPQPFTPPPVKRSQAELPFARKASLARFLEKRKDRVEAMQSKTHETKGESATICSDDSPQRHSCSSMTKRPKLQHF